MEYKDPGRYIPILYLLYSWGSRFGVPSRVPLHKARRQDRIIRRRVWNPKLKETWKLVSYSCSVEETIPKPKPETL